MRAAVRIPQLNISSVRYPCTDLMFFEAVQDHHVSDLVEVTPFGNVLH